MLKLVTRLSPADRYMFAWLLLSILITLIVFSSVVYALLIAEWWPLWIALGSLVLLWPREIAMTRWTRTDPQERSS